MWCQNDPGIDLIGVFGVMSTTIFSCVAPCALWMVRPELICIGNCVQVTLTRAREATKDRVIVWIGVHP